MRWGRCQKVSSDLYQWVLGCSPAFLDPFCSSGLKLMAHEPLIWLLLVFLQDLTVFGRYLCIPAERRACSSWLPGQIFPFLESLLLQAEADGDWAALAFFKAPPKYVWNLGVILKNGLWAWLAQNNSRASTRGRGRIHVSQVPSCNRH